MTILKRRIAVPAFVFLLTCFSTLFSVANAESIDPSASTYTTREGQVHRLSDNLQAKKIYTEPKKGSWVKESVMVKVRSTNGKRYKITLSNSTRLSNARIVWSSVTTLSTGEWSTSGIKIEKIDKNKGWSYDLRFEAQEL